MSGTPQQGSFSEHAPAAVLLDAVACTWERAVTGDAAVSTRILPDGSADLIWFGDGRLMVAGPDTGPVESRLAPGAEVAGLRLRPGWAGAALGLPAGELRDQRVPLAEVWPAAAGRLVERLSLAEGPEARRRLLEEALAARLRSAEPADRLVLEAIRHLGGPGDRVGALAARLGVSERQLRRRFLTAVGYGPKTLDRILRFRGVVAEAAQVAEGRQSLAGLAAARGYADQPHLSREVARLAGMAPRALVTAWGGSPG